MESLADLWSRAQQFEAQKNWEQARAVYESLLAREPHHVPARLRMSRFEQFADRYLTSKEHLWRAVDSVREYGSTRHMAHVTARLLEFAEEEEVAALILSVNWSDPHVVRQSPVLAQHLWLSGRYQDTLRFLDSVAARVPAHPLLAYTRGNVLRYLGDMPGAEQQYEACLALSPDFPDAHWSLATHSRAQPPLARVARIRDALTRSPGEGVERAHLLYALFREYDAADDTEEAWSALSQGAAIMRTLLKFDTQREAARFEALLQMPVQEIETASDEIPAPGLIVGMPRTGTTLLDRILGNHAAVTSLGERNDFAAAVSETSGRFFRPALQADNTDVLRHLDLQRVGHLYLQRLRMLAPDARFVIDKNPQNLFNLPLILQALPGVRVLCLQRDPMDACFSNLKELFQGEAYPYSYALEDLADHYLRARRWMEHWQRVAPRSVRVVRYEDLVSDPDAVLPAILEFVGLEMQSDLLDITRNTAPVATASSSQVREGIHQRGMEAWQRYERHLQPLRARLGE